MAEDVGQEREGRSQGGGQGSRIDNIPTSGPLISLRTQAILVGLITTALYLLLSERIFFFDGVVFAGIVEYALADPGADGSLLWSYPKHYLYVPTIYGLAWPLSIFAPAVDAYRLMQILAGLLAGTLNGALFLYLRRRIAALWVCLALVGIWAFSNIHWERALEGQTYFAGQFWAILTLLTFVTAGMQVSTRTVWLMAVFTALSGLFHVSNVIVVVPIAVAWLWSRGTEAWRPLGGYLLKAAVLTATLPVLHYRLWNPGELRRWVMTSVNDTEFHSWGAFALPTFSNLVEKSIQPFSGFLVVLGGSPVATITGLVLTALFVAALAIGLTPVQRTGKEKDPVVPLAMATFATWAIFFSVIAPGYLFHWEIAAFALWLLLVAGYLQAAESGHIWRLKTMTTILAILLIGVPGFNLFQKYWSISRPDYNQDALAAARLGERIPPGEMLHLLGGGARDNNLKAYMVHFGLRGWTAADITMMRAPENRRCTLFSQQVHRRLEQEGRVFLSTTLLDRSSVASVGERYTCPDMSTAEMFRGMSCLILDDTTAIGLVLAVPAQGSDLAGLEDFYRATGSSDLAVTLRDTQAFVPCSDGIPSLARAPSS